MRARVSMLTWTHQLCFGLLQLQFNLLLLELQELFLFGQKLLSDLLLLGQAGLTHSRDRLGNGWGCYHGRRLGGSWLGRRSFLRLEKERAMKKSHISSGG